MQVDKILHFFVCFGICLLLCPLIGWWSIGTAVATGVGKELYDWKDYGNFSWWDIVADLAGVVVAVYVRGRSSTYSWGGYLMACVNQKMWTN